VDFKIFKANKKKKKKKREEEEEEEEITQKRAFAHLLLISYKLYTIIACAYEVFPSIFMQNEALQLVDREEEKKRCGGDL
jgi:hypothetical protein